MEQNKKINKANVCLFKKSIKGIESILKEFSDSQIEELAENFGNKLSLDVFQNLMNNNIDSFVEEVDSCLMKFTGDTRNLYLCGIDKKDIIPDVFNLIDNNSVFSIAQRGGRCISVWNSNMPTISRMRKYNIRFIWRDFE